MCNEILPDNFNATVCKLTISMPNWITSQSIFLIVILTYPSKNPESYNDVSIPM